MRLHLLLLFCSIFTCVCAEPKAVCNIFGFAGTSGLMSWGDVTIIQTGTTSSSISGNIINLGLGDHGIHIHQWGDLTNPSSSGSHYNNIAPRCSGIDGEWGNITSNGTRVQTEAKFVMNATINDFQDIIGRSIIIHELADNCNDTSGAKIAGCVIGVASTDPNIAFQATEIPSCVLGSTGDSTVDVSGSIEIAELKIADNEFTLHLSGSILDVQQLNISLLMDGNLDSLVDGNNTDIVSESFALDWTLSRSSLGRTILLRPIASPTPSSTTDTSTTGTSTTGTRTTGTGSRGRTAPEPSPEAPIGFCVVGRKAAPSVTPSMSPSVTPSMSPSVAPSVSSVTPSMSPSVASSVTPSIAPSVTPSTPPSSSALATPSILPSPSNASRNETEESPNQTGMIVGVVFAGLILIGLGLFLYRRSQRNQRQGFTRTIGEF